MNPGSFNLCALELFVVFKCPAQLCKDSEIYPGAVICSLILKEFVQVVENVREKWGRNGPEVGINGILVWIRSLAEETLGIIPTLLLQYKIRF